MASYMYMSATGHNWDDDEDDENFEFGSCTAVIQSSAAPAIHNSKEYCVADHHTSPFPSMPTNDNVERTFDTASYMYISPTGRNWDDNDEEEVFDLEAFTQSTMHVLDDLAPLQLETAVSEEFESESELEQFVSPAPIESTIYKTIESDFWPSYAQKMTERWFYSDSCPAYTELSHDGNDYFPEVRVQYTANWTATKLRMGSNIRNPIMMRPSPLRLSKTWVQDSLGEYVEDRGSLFPSMPSPGLGYDSTSDEEHDEACTPPGSPLRAQDKECEIEIEEYDPTTGAIDLSMQNMDAMEVNLLQEFEAFSAVAEDLDFEDILGITASKLGHVRDGELQIWDDQSAYATTDILRGSPACSRVVEISEVCAENTVTRSPIECSDNAHPITELVTTMIGATNTTTPLSGALTLSPFAGSNSIKSDTSPSPDLQYIRDPTSTTLVLNTVAAGWFALSAAPWGRIAVAMAGTVFDVAALFMRRLK